MKQQLIDLITESLGAIDPQYYKLLTAYNSEGIVRERVFCYELYHQIRQLKDNYGALRNISIHGEIDKSGHTLFEQNDQKNPDFVFHVPGNMIRNSCVVEVKGKINQKKELIKDLNTIGKFILEYNYLFGISICYNYSLSEIKSRLLSGTVRPVGFQFYNKIVLICKKTPDSVVEVCSLDSIYQG